MREIVSKGNGSLGFLGHNSSWILSSMTLRTQHGFMNQWAKISSLLNIVWASENTFTKKHIYKQQVWILKFKEL